LAALAWGLTGCGGGGRAGAPDGDPPEAAGDDAGAGPDAAIAPDASTAWVSDAGLRDAEGPETSIEGSKACGQATEVRRACVDDSDCVAVLHVTDCCGSGVWVGIRASAVTSFDTLEAACERSYSQCACAARAPTTDDGSIVRLGGQAAVAASCQAGVCKSFAAACGQACGAGKSCTTCDLHGTTTALCARRCSKSSDCQGGAETACDTIAGVKLCVAPQAVCRGL
jgi:hypothetical protein